MMHDKRVWSVRVVETAEALAEGLTTHYAYCLCNGAVVQGHPDYVFLNDSTSEDALQEYGIVKGGIGATSHRQIESITFSWCDYDQALEHIRRALSGEDDEGVFAHDIHSPRLERPKEHGSCRLCR